MTSADWYAVVDDIGEGTIKLEIARWPQADDLGRLHFSQVHEQVYNLEKLQQAVNRARRRQRQVAPDRTLRIGDAFCIRTPGSSRRPGRALAAESFAGSVIDVTTAARAQAKIALHGAVARRLRPGQARASRRMPPGAERFQRQDDPDAGPAKRPRLPGAIAEAEI